MKYIIGNGEEIPPWKPERKTSFHLRNLTTGEEVAIRYDLESIQDAYENHWQRRFEGKSVEEAPREFFQIEAKPIFRQFA